MQEILFSFKKKKAGATFSLLTTTGTPPASFNSIKGAVINNYLYTYALWSGTGSNFRRLNLDTLVWQSISADTVGNYTNFALAATSSKLWVMAGNNNGDRTNIAAYNTGTLSWEFSMNATYTNTNAGAIALGDILYSCGGTNSWAFQTFNTLTKTPTGASLPSNYPGNGAQSILGTHQTNLYVYGGTGAGVSNLLSRYDTVGKTWTLIGTAPQGAYNAGNFATIGDDLYTFGGIVNGLASNKLMKYNIPTNTWSEVATSPAQLGAKAGCSLCAYNGALYLFEANGSANVWKITI